MTRPVNFIVVAWAALMIGCGSTLAAASQRDAVAVTFGPVPNAGMTVRTIAWPDGAPVDVLARVAVDRGTRLVVALPPGRLVVVLVAASNGQYLIDGPFVWPATATFRPLSQVWRHTVAGASVEPGASIAWVGASHVAAEWPSCRWRMRGSWECLGLDQASSGVILFTGGTGIRFAAVTPGRGAAMIQRAAWGRMIVLPSSAAGDPTSPTCKALRLEIPPRRPQTLRIRAVPVASVMCIPMNTGVWVAAEQNVVSGWMEVRAGRLAPVRLSFDDLSAGPPQLPVDAPLAPAAAIRGTARDLQQQPMPGVQLSLFRWLDEPLRLSRPPRRVLEAEKTSEEDGTYEFTGLAEGTYEVVGLDSQAGRAAITVDAPAQDAELRFAPRATARGRVVRDGEPQSGVPVTVVPDLAAFEQSEDPTRLRGGSAQTGPDGAFSVALPMEGGGDVIVGGGDWPVRRLPLPATLPAVFDAGTIELGGGIDVTAVLDGADGCTLLFTGPLGRSGLQIVHARLTSPGVFSVRVPEPGAWATALLCGRQEVRVTPAVMTIDASKGTATVTLTRQ